MSSVFNIDETEVYELENDEELLKEVFDYKTERESSLRSNFILRTTNKDLSDQRKTMRISSFSSAFNCSKTPTGSPKVKCPRVLLVDEVLDPRNFPQHEKQLQTFTDVSSIKSPQERNIDGCPPRSGTVYKNQVSNRSNVDNVCNSQFCIDTNELHFMKQNSHSTLNSGSDTCNRSFNGLRYTRNIHLEVGSPGLAGGKPIMDSMLRDNSCINYGLSHLESEEKPGCSSLETSKARNKCLPQNHKRRPVSSSGSEPSRLFKDAALANSVLLNSTDRGNKIMHRPTNIQSKNYTFTKSPKPSFAHLQSKRSSSDEFAIDFKANCSSLNDYCRNSKKQSSSTTQNTCHLEGLQNCVQNTVMSSPNIITTCAKYPNNVCRNDVNLHVGMTPDILTSSLTSIPKTSEQSFTSGFPFNIRRPATPRRFPGPAGILPMLEAGENVENWSNTVALDTAKNSPEICTMVFVGGDEDFEDEPWTLMQERVIKDFPDVAESIASILQKARSQKLEKGKVLFLSALVKAFCTNGLDASVVLRDPSGEICGTLHQKVLEERHAELGTGCGLFLKKVSVFSPSIRKHYLNITPGNILEIFPANVKTDFCRDEKLSDTLNRKELEPTASEQHASIDVSRNAGVKQTDGSFEELLRGLDDDDDDLLMQAMNL